MNFLHGIRNSTSADSADSSATIQGIADQQVIFVKIQWGWIAAPVILSAVSALFVPAAIAQSLSFGSYERPKM